MLADLHSWRVAPALVGAGRDRKTSCLSIASEGSQPDHRAGKGRRQDQQRESCRGEIAGSFLPNAFGLHDVHGNLWEWCLDEYGSYSGTVRAGDGLRLLGTGSATRCNRGGNFDFPAAHARSSNRRHNAPSLRGNGLGARAARAFRLDN